MIYETH